MLFQSKGIEDVVGFFDEPWIAVVGGYAKDVHGLGSSAGHEGDIAYLFTVFDSGSGELEGILALESNFGDLEVI